MTKSSLVSLALCAVLALFVCTPQASAQSYTLSGNQWPQGSVIRYFINTESASPAMSAEQVIEAVQLAAKAWNDLGLSVRFEYGGPSSETALPATNDTRNHLYDIFFTSIIPANGLCCFTQNWVTSAKVIVESNTQMAMAWALGDVTRSYYAEDQTCEGSGQYVRTIMAHEFGHALGIWHSADPAATMYANIPLCSRDGVTLEPDDIAAARALYGAAEPDPVPEPAPVPPPSTPLLTVKAYKLKGVKRADLQWQNVNAGSVDIFRDAAAIRRGVLNTGFATDDLGTKGGGSATYRVCEAGTATCAQAVAQW